jgi:hypothetical protein
MGEVLARLVSVVVVDVESDGPSPGHYSMMSFGAVLVDRPLGTTLKGRIRPVSGRWVPETLAMVCLGLKLGVA